MAIDILKRLAVFIVLALVQTLVFNHIRLFGYAMPLLYVYFIIITQRGYPRWATLVWAFMLGLVVDVFANTPGAAAASLTLVGLLQPYLLELFVSREAVPNLKVSLTVLGWVKFLALAAILTFVHCAAFFSLEMFTFVDLTTWILCVLGSTLLTLILIMGIESVRRS
jgi:rod shape-determining protein MreD